LFVIHDLGPDQSCARVSISVEHRLLKYVIAPYTPGGYICRATHRAAFLCDFTWGPRLEDLFLGSFKFGIDQVMYQGEKEKSTGSLVYPKKKGCSSAVGERMGISHTLVCGIPEVRLIFADLRGGIGDQTEAAGHK